MRLLLFRLLPLRVEAGRVLLLRAVPLRAVLFRAVLLRAALLRVLLALRLAAVRRLPPVLFLRDGTFLPFLRASDNPIAIACLRLVTFRPLPLLNEPRLRRLIALFTSFEAPREYFRAMRQILLVGATSPPARQWRSQ